jgi:hypothetical protein
MDDKAQQRVDGSYLGIETKMLGMLPPERTMDQSEWCYFLSRLSVLHDLRE